MAMTINYAKNNKKTDDSLINLNYNTGDGVEILPFSNELNKSIQIVALQQKIRRDIKLYNEGQDASINSALIDSLMVESVRKIDARAAFFLEKKDSSEAFAFSDSLKFKTLSDSVSIPFEDLAFLPIDEILSKYNVDLIWIQRTIFRQILHSFREPEALVRAYIGSMTWTLLAVNSFMAAVLMLLYRKRKRFYVEHFLFLVHVQCGMLLAGLLAFWVQNWSGIQIWIPLALAFFPYMYYALKRFYGGRWLPTLLRGGAFLLFYIGAICTFFLVGLAVVFTLF